MKTLITLFISFIALTGCFYQNVNDNDIKLGQLFCESKGSELRNIDAWFSGNESVHCKNNAWTSLSSLTPEEINKLKTN